MPPTEAGIHRIDKWQSESKTTSTAVRFALDTFKGPSQLNFDSVKKTYVGENWFRGMPNPKHRAFTDPALKDFLFPAYVVRYLDADAIRPSDQVPMQLIDVFVDAENNSIFGYIIWSAGGSGAVPAKSLIGERFSTIKLSEKSDVPIKLTLSGSQATGKPAGISAVIFSETKAVKVLVDRQYQVVWRGNTPYSANEEFWRAVSK